MKDFSNLSRRIQRNKFKELGKNALNQYGIHGGTLRFISDTSNVIFKVNTPGQQYVLRIDPEPIKPRFKMRIETELYWLTTLRKETDLEVPAPIKTTKGNFVAIASTKSIPGGRYVSLLRWMEGRLIGERP